MESGGKRSVFRDGFIFIDVCVEGNDIINLISNNAKNLCCNNHNKGMKGATSNIVLYNFNRQILHFVII